MLSDVVVPNLHHRYTGVSATVKALVPCQRQTLPIGLLDQGRLGLPGCLQWSSLWRLGWTRPQAGRWRIWHARRDTEILLGLVLRSVLHQPWKVIFTSAAPKRPGFWLRQLICRCDYVIATSPRSAGFLDRYDQVIFHGVDVNSFQPPHGRDVLLREVGLEGKHCISSFGRIRPSKGTDLLVDAVLPILPHFLDWVVVITGLCQAKDAAYLEEIHARIRAAGLEDRFRFVGDLHPDEIRLWYQRSSICVAASRREGFGLTPLEAMASGCVPVTSEAGAWPWIIETSFGAMFQTGSAESLRLVLESLLGDPHRLAALGHQAREVASRQFSIQVEADALNRVYLDLMEASASTVDSLNRSLVGGGCQP